MKATVELPDSLLREAEAAAEHAGVPFDEYLAALLREKLESRPSHSRKEWPVPPPQVDDKETKRIQRFIDEEFGRIELENWK